MNKLTQDLQHLDAIDFATEDIGSLFRKMFLPTLLGMVSIVILNLADGAFVGHGAGTEALAAINIAAPIYNLMIGIAIMFGIGASVIASIHLSKGNVKAARINATQSLLGSFLLTGVLSLLIQTNLETTCRLFGSSETLVPLASSYLKWVALSLPFSVLGNVGAFIVRLDGSPKFAMACSLGASVLNIFLDWLFVFPFHWGLEGAAIATSISFSLSAVVTLYYMAFMAKTLTFYPLRLNFTSLVLTLRNLWYQIKAGFAALLGELAIAFTIILGNFVFVHYLGNDGVAAFGVVCYCMPVIFMLANAIVQSIQPILSFAYGRGDKERLLQAGRIALRNSLGTGLFATFCLVFASRWITMLFIPSSELAFDICVSGMRYFGVAGILISVNILFVGYLQSVEKSLMANFYSLMRGFLILFPSFILMPEIFGVPGLWLAIPVAELVTLLIMVVVISVQVSRLHKKGE